MKLIDILTDSPSQKQIIRLENGENLNFFMYYSYNQQGWFYDLNYGNVNLYGRRIVTSLNLLRQIRNTIPFGLACLVTDKQEPVFIDDFKTGRAKFYTLNAEDVARFEELIGSV